MTEKKTDCPVCETTGSLTRLLANITIQKTIEPVVGKPGDIVNASIREYREELKEIRADLKEKSNEFTD